jgi:hypothetical protein
MCFQGSSVSGSGGATAPGFGAARAVEIRRADIRWLEDQIGQLESSNGARELKLAGCYRKLLRSRRGALAPGAERDNAWRDYLC